MNDFSKMNEVVTGWLKEARFYILDHIMDENLEIETKASYFDLATNVDREVEELLRSRIKEHFPDDEILGEELGGSYDPNSPGATWIIDPLDGTLNFVTQQSNCGTMVARYVNGEGQFGAICNAVTGDILIGNKDHGIYLNGHPYSPPKDIVLNESLVFLNDKLLLEDLYSVDKLRQETLGYRINGSCALDFMSLIKGQCALYIHRMSPWDAAAAQVIINESDIKISQIDQSPLSMQKVEYIVAGYPSAVDTYFKILEKD